MLDSSLDGAAEKGLIALKAMISGFSVVADKFEVHQNLPSLTEVTVWIDFPHEWIEIYEVLYNFLQITDDATGELTNCHTTII